MRSKKRHVPTGIVSASGTTLSADSTALALARLSIGDLPTTKTGADIDIAIRAAPNYSALVASVSMALANGNAPSEDSVVIGAVAATIATVSTKISATSVRALAKAISRPTATLPLPFLVVPDTVLNGALPVQISGVVPPNTIVVKNNMPIPWSIGSVGATGSQLSNNVPLPGGTLLGAGYAYATGDLSGFTLTVSQTSDTQATIISDVSWGAITTALAFVQPTTCDGTLVKTTIKGAIAAGQIKTLATWPATIASLQTFMTASNVSSILKNCASPNVAAVVGPIAAFLKAYSFTKAIGTGIGAFAEGVYANANWETQSKNVGVCLASSGDVMNCAVSYTFSPPSLLLAPGASEHAPQISAVDANGLATGVPSGLTYQSSDSIQLPTDASTGTVTANSNLIGGGGPYTVSVADSAGTGNGTFTATVVVPQISPMSATTQVGGPPIVLTLTDSVGQPVALPTGVTWKSSDVNQSTITNIGSNLTPGVSTWRSALPQVPGVVTITALDPAGIAYSTGATITVTGPAPPTVTLSASPATIASGGSSTVTWSSANATSCTATGGWTSSTATSGTASVGPLTATTTYSMTCSDASGNVSAPASAVVTVGPGVNYVYYLVFQYVACGQTASGSFSISPTGGGAMVATGSASYTGSCPNGEGIDPGKTFGPTSLTLPPGSYTASFTYSGTTTTSGGGLQGYSTTLLEIDYANGLNVLLLGGSDQGGTRMGSF